MSPVAAVALEARDLALSYGPLTVLAGVTVSVGPGSRTAVVGPNGVGKSTLLRLLAGLEQPESGTLVRRPSSATVVLLPQERDRRSGETLREYLHRRTGVADAEAALHDAAEALAGERPGAGQEYDAALEAFLALGGADLDGRAPGVLADLGLRAELLDQTTTSLSGGELARSALAALLLSRADVLLLDEPTNDLDTDGLHRLESFLADRDGGLVVVSHDRAFLERVATDVLEIDEHQRTGRVVGGGFQAYLRERERTLEAARDARRAYEETRDGLVERARRDKNWARQGAARATSARARNDEPDRNARAAAVAGAQSRSAAAGRTLRALDRLEEAPSVREAATTSMRLASAARGSDDVAGLSAAVVDRGAFRLGPVDLALRRGDRVAVAGANGSGKSTLLAALLGRLPLTAGQRWVGPATTVGEIGQVRRGLAADETLGAAFRGRTGLAEAEARTLLAGFGLGADDVARRVGSLSPGERTRADLSLLVATRANLLVLDEPTNHLDLPAIEALESALGTYDGTLLLVTHDRRLLERVQTDRRLVVADGLVRED